MNQPRVALHRWLHTVLGALFLALVALTPVLARPTQATHNEPNGINVIQSDSARLQFKLNLPQPTFSAEIVNGSRVYDITLDGFGQLNAEGLPNLPYQSFQVAIPLGAVPELTVVSAESRTVHNITPLSAPTESLVSYDSQNSGAIPEFSEMYQTDSAAQRTAAAATDPASVVSLSTVQWLRDFRVVNVVIRPIQTNPATNSLTVHDSIEVAIDFAYPNGKPAAAAMRPESEPFTKLFEANLLNYAAAKTWRSVPTTAAPSGTGACTDANAYRIDVQETGMYKLTSSMLAGLPSSVPINELRLCHKANEQAIDVIDTNANGVFDSADSLIFFGEALKTHDTETNVYWLTYGGANGLRMAALNGSVSNGGALVNHSLYPIHLERDERYYPEFPLNDVNDTHDHWYFDPIAYSVANPQSLDLTFELDAISSTVSPTVEIMLTGFQDSETRRFQLALNGTPIGPIHSFTTDAKYNSAVTFTVAAPASLFVAGSNTVSVQTKLSPTPNGDNRITVDWVKVTAPRLLVAADNQLSIVQQTAGLYRYQTSGFSSVPTVYDVSQPDNATIVSGLSGGEFAPDFASSTFPARYELIAADAYLTPSAVTKDVASNWASAGHSADYIIITDPTLTGALAPLISYHQAQGLDVETVYVQDIFDEFSYGIYDTYAIRDFLYYAYTNWGGALAPFTPSNTPPTYVLLAGDASHDHRNVLGKNGSGNLVPVFLRSGRDFFLGEVAADNQYVAFGNYPSYGDLPFMLLGRLPASDSAELSTMISKMITYESTPLSPANQGQHLFIADNQMQSSRQPNCAADPAGEFHTIVDNFVRDYVTPYGQYADRIFYANCHENDPVIPDWYAFDPVDVATRFAVSMQAGRGFVSYTGHAGITRWADESILDINVMQSLNNSNDLPILLSMACLEGQYHRFDLTHYGTPVPSGLSEAAVKMGGGGAVAAFAPTGLAVATGHEFLLEGFYDAVYGDQQETLGAAAFTAKWHLKDRTPNFQDLHDTYMLLGDPAMALNVWRVEQRVMLPVVQR